MNDIKRIIIKTYSGWCPIDTAYEDALTITSDTIKYIYKPEIISEENPAVKWNFSISTDKYKTLYDDLCARVWDILHDEETKMLFCTDIGGVDFTVVLQDNKKISEHYQVPEDEFKDVFDIISLMIDGFQPIKNGYYWHNICEDDDDE